MKRVGEIAYCIFWYAVGLVFLGAFIKIFTIAWKEILLFVCAAFAIAYGSVYVPIWLEKFLNLQKRTRSLILAGIVGAIVVFTVPQIFVSPTTSRSISETVYVTNTGHKYHRSSCRYLRYSSNAIDLDRAISKGYGACSVCRP